MFENVGIIFTSNQVKFLSYWTFPTTSIFYKSFTVNTKKSIALKLLLIIVEKKFVYEIQLGKYNSKKKH